MAGRRDPPAYDLASIITLLFIVRHGVKSFVRFSTSSFRHPLRKPSQRAVISPCVQCSFHACCLPPALNGMSLIALSLLVLNSYTSPSTTFPLYPREEAARGDPKELIHGYVDDPRGRGTVGIIMSCLVTLALCVWSALHLNVRMKSETRVRRYLRYIKWIALGTFIPELVVLSAWRQWLSAKSMGLQMKKIFDEEYAEQKQEGEGTDFSKVCRFPIMNLQPLTLAGIHHRQDHCGSNWKDEMDFCSQHVCNHGRICLRHGYAPWGGRFVHSRSRSTYPNRSGCTSPCQMRSPAYNQLQVHQRQKQT
jgi:hypothetical protein